MEIILKVITVSLAILAGCGIIAIGGILLGCFIWILASWLDVLIKKITKD